MVTVDCHEKLRFLFERHRYKVAYGGRAGTKSWAFARALLIMGLQRRLLIVCARETMKSIKESQHRLLEQQIQLLGLSGHYEVLEQEIRGKNGTEFIFAGLKHNIDNIKSLEGADICWVEEAANVSAESWRKLAPTMRKEGSEIWVSFNPELATDETYRRFVLSPPEDSRVVKIGWQDAEPGWLSETILAEIAALQRTNPEEYRHVYGGEPRSSVHGAIFSAQFKDVDAEGRICAVPYNRARPVDTVWDLGFEDLTAIWFVQAYDGWFHFIDYLEGDGLTIADYVVELQSRGYVYGTDWLPHDAVDTIIHKRLAGDRSMSVEQLLRQAGRKPRLVPKMLVSEGINAARTVFSQCRFDAGKCADGLQALRHYQWGEQTDREKELGIRKREPLHDRNSHAADAFRCAAIVLRQPELPKPKPDRPRHYGYGAPGGYAPFG